jgi:hypothetical protein
MRRWEDNVKRYLKKIRCDCVYWIHVVQNTVQQRA